MEGNLNLLESCFRITTCWKVNLNRMAWPVISSENAVKNMLVLLLQEKTCLFSEIHLISNPGSKVSFWFSHYLAMKVNPGKIGPRPKIVIWFRICCAWHILKSFDIQNLCICFFPFLFFISRLTPVKKADRVQNWCWSDPVQMQQRAQMPRCTQSKLQRWQAAIAARRICAITRKCLIEEICRAG